MESFTVVRPEHLNHYGYLFGGDLLRWVDELSWAAASRDYPGCHFVTVGMDQVQFQRSVRQGSVLRFDIQRAKLGTTSVQYQVLVYSDDLASGQEESLFATRVTFVCIDAEGCKVKLPEQPL